MQLSDAIPAGALDWSRHPHPDGGPDVWRSDLPGGGELVWDGFFTGPLALTDAEIAGAAESLLGLSLDSVPAAADRELRPYAGGGAVRSIVVHSATPVLKFLQADMLDAHRGRPADDVATYIETRAVALARPGDLVVGRTRPWELAARMSEAEAVPVPGIELYYLSHALLRLLVAEGGGAPAVARLVGALRERPDSVVRLYALDRETQIVLLALRRLAGIDVLYTDANSAEVGDVWNTKGPLHPSVSDAAALSVAGLSPDELLAAENALAPLSVRLGARFPAVPGYTVCGPGELAAAARLLVARYGLERGCLKPSHGGAGARIVLDVPLADEAAVQRLEERTHDEPYVLEAQIAYGRAACGGDELVLAPSAHIRDGAVAEGLTLQFVRGTAWRGNVYVDEAGCESVGLPIGAYRTIRAAVEDLHTAFDRSGHRLVTAGIDFAVGQVGGAFGDRALVALEDPNLSAHGAEYLRRFLEAGGASSRYAATRIVRPDPSTSLAELRALDLPAREGERLETLSVVPGRWGMIAAAAGSPAAAASAVLAYEHELAARGRVAPT